jgi:hypothetical protein
MPLDRAHVTVASRVMLPTYATIFGLLGLLFLVQQPSRTAAPAFAPAKMLFSWLPIDAMHGWGLVFLAVATLEVVALVARNRKLYFVGLVIGAGLVMFWTVVLLAAAFQSPQVSFTSAVWVGGWIAAHIATGKSLRSGER